MNPSNEINQCDIFIATYGHWENFFVLSLRKSNIPEICQTIYARKTTRIYYDTIKHEFIS